MCAEKLENEGLNAQAVKRVSVRLKWPARDKPCILVTD